MKQGKNSAEKGSRVDRGWAKMQPILAKELPLDGEKKHRWAWLWIGLLGIAIGGLGVWLYPNATPLPISTPITDAPSVKPNTDVSKAINKEKIISELEAELKVKNNADPTNSKALVKKNDNTPSQKSTQRKNQEHHIKTPISSTRQAPQSYTQGYRQSHTINHTQNRTMALHDKPTRSKTIIKKQNRILNEILSKVPNRAPNKPLNKIIDERNKTDIALTHKSNHKKINESIPNSILNPEKTQKSLLQNIVKVDPKTTHPISITRTDLSFPINPISLNKVAEKSTRSLAIELRSLYSLNSRRVSQELALNPKLNKGSFSFGVSVGLGYNFKNTYSVNDDSSADLTSMPEGELETEDTSNNTEPNPTAGTSFENMLQAYDRNTAPLEQKDDISSIIDYKKTYVLTALSIDYRINNHFTISKGLGTNHYFQNVSDSNINLLNSPINPTETNEITIADSRAYYGEIRMQYHFSSCLGANLGYRYSIKSFNGQKLYYISAGLQYNL